MKLTPGSVVAFASVVPSLQAAISITSSTESWNPVMYGELPSMDPAADHQTGIAEGDIVGDSQHPSFYTAFSEGEIGFRLRVGADSNPGGFNVNAWIGIDINRDGAINLFVGAKESSAIGIYPAGTDLNISPSTTSLDSSAPYYEIPSASASYATSFSFMAVSATSDPTASNYNLDGGTGNGAVDHFVSFKMPFSELQAAVTRLGIPGASINESTPLRYVVATSNQANSLNQDLNGITGGQSSAEIWESLGGMTSPYSATGEIVPEPSTFGLAGGGLFLLMRRKRG